MKNVEKKIDINTLVEDFKYELLIEKGKNEISLSFRNATDNIITEMAFEAMGYDYFGEKIAIGEKSFFLLELKNLMLFPGDVIRDYRIPVSKAIRCIQLKQSYVIDLNQKKQMYEGNKDKIYYFDKFYPDHYKDKNELDMLQKFDKNAICYPKEEEKGWLCCCGYYNPLSRDICKYCRKTKEEVFFETTKEAILRKLQKEEKEFYQRMEQRMLEKEKNDRRRSIIFWIEFVLGICIVIGFFAVLVYF